MKEIFKSLKAAGDREGGVELASGDGLVRRCHPILAVYVADYPEQCLVTCTRYMHCPICYVEPSDLGEYGDYRKRKQHETLRHLDEARTMSRTEANQLLKRTGNTDTFKPFFEDLPFTDINNSITPDILHQLYQGVIKHLTQWLTRLVGPNELDLRLSRLPPNNALRVFKSGISTFSRLSGNEHRQIAKQILGCIIDSVPSEATRAARALLDFLYIAQAEVQTERTLEKLEDALEEFHKFKYIFLDTNAREGTFVLHVSETVIRTSAHSIFHTKLKTLTSLNYMVRYITDPRFVSLGPPTTTTRRTRSDFTSTWQRMRTKLPTERTSSPR